MLKIIEQLPKVLANGSMWQKYFSEVGYVRRELNRVENILRHYGEYAERRKLATRFTRSLSSAQKDIIQGLQNDGFSKTELQSLQIDRSVLHFCRKLTERYSSLTLKQVMELRKDKAKDYWLDMYEKPETEWDPITELATNRTILEIVSVYMGEVPTLQAIEYNYSPPYAGEYKGSQLWHRDNDQRKRVKIFLSPFDMSSEHGPTILFPTYLSSNKFYKNFPNYFTDIQAQEFGLSLNRAYELTGVAGTMHFVDTSRCLHCGSRSKLARHLLIITYRSLASFVPYKKEKLSAPPAYLNNCNRAILEKIRS